MKRRQRFTRAERRDRLEQARELRALRAMPNVKVYRNLAAALRAWRAGPAIAGQAGTWPPSRGCVGVSL